MSAADLRWVAPCVLTCERCPRPQAGSQVSYAAEEGREQGGAYATREELIPHVVEKAGGAAFGLKADTYKDIEFNVVLTPLVQGKDNQIVNRLRASATA